MAKVIIVNEKDEEIGLADRSELGGDEICRVSALWLTNSKGEVLLAQRKLNKKFHPGMWGPSASGTVDEGETYRSNMEKEIEEELGINSLELREELKRFVNDGAHRRFTQWFSAIADIAINDFRIQEDEVEAIKWISPRDLVADIEKNPESYIQSVSYALENFVK